MIETYWIQFADGHVLEINQTYILRIILNPVPWLLLMTHIS